MTNTNNNQKQELQVLDNVLKSANSVKQIARALAHKKRSKLLQFFATKPDAQVNDAYRALKMEQSETSQHLAILRKAGVMIREKAGRTASYRVVFPVINRYAESFNTLSNIASEAQGDKKARRKRISDSHLGDKPQPKHPATGCYANIQSGLKK